MSFIVKSTVLKVGLILHCYMKSMTHGTNVNTVHDDTNIVKMSLICIEPNITLLWIYKRHHHDIPDCDGPYIVVLH